MVYARVLTFHVEADHMPTVIEALQGALDRWRDHSGFRGLLCLEHDGLREEVMIIALWDASCLAETARQAEEARELIADATDAGVASRAYEVLGFVPGVAGAAGSAGAAAGATAGGVASRVA